MRIDLKPGWQYLGFFVLLRWLLKIKYGRGGIAYVNFILHRLNFRGNVYDRKNDVRFRLKFNDLISMAILKHGCYEPASLTLAINALRKRPGLFLDIGANFGLYTVYASKLPGVRTVSIDEMFESFLAWLAVHLGFAGVGLILLAVGFSDLGLIIAFLLVLALYSATPDRGFDART